MFIPLPCNDSFENVILRHIISELSEMQIFKFKRGIVGIFKEILTDIILVIKSTVIVSVTTNQTSVLLFDSLKSTVSPRPDFNVCLLVLWDLSETGES